MEKIDTDYKIEKFCLNFPRCTNRDVAPLSQQTLCNLSNSKSRLHFQNTPFIHKLKSLFLRQELRLPKPNI